MSRVQQRKWTTIKCYTVASNVARVSWARFESCCTIALDTEPWVETTQRECVTTRFLTKRIESMWRTMAAQPRAMSAFQIFITIDALFADGISLCIMVNLKLANNRLQKSVIKYWENCDCKSRNVDTTIVKIETVVLIWMHYGSNSLGSKTNVEESTTEGVGPTRLQTVLRTNASVHLNGSHDKALSQAPRSPNTSDLFLLIRHNKISSIKIIN